MSTSSFRDRLSARLNDVPLPDDLLGRLQAIPIAADADLDRELAAVALPADLPDQLLAIASAPRRWSPGVSENVKRVAAAVFMFAIGMGYVLSVTALVYSRFDQPLLAAEPLRAAWSQLAGAAAGEEAWVRLEATAEPVSHAETDDDIDANAEGHIPDIDRDETDGARLAHDMGLVGEPIALADLCDPVGGPVATNLMAASVDAATERLGGLPIERSCVRIVGEPSADVGSGTPGRALPWFDAAKTGAVQVELSLDDASYRYCRHEVGSGRLPLEACVRVEEFLAPFEYDLVDRDLARSGDRPAITVAAGPSPYGLLADTPASATDRRRWLVAVGVGMPGAADSPSVTLDFAPQRVTAYRMVGYGLAAPSAEERAEAGPGPVGWASERERACERASTILLFEMELADGEASPVALGEVRVAWHDAQGRALSAEAPLNWHSLAERFDTAPVGWRQAALVALAGESLAGSPFTEHVSLADVVRVARQIEPLVDDRAGWREFIEMIGRAQSLRVISQSIRRLAGA